MAGTQRSDDPAPDDPALAWVQLGERAEWAFQRGDTENARRFWQDSHRLVDTELSAPHPLLAASFCNLACVSRIGKNYADGVRHGERSIALWETAKAWVDGMRFESTARSSTFHLRMYGRHRDAYRRLRLGKYRALLILGRTTAMNNLAGVFCMRGRFEEARALYLRALHEREEAMRVAEIDDTAIDVIRRNLAVVEGKAERKARAEATKLSDRGETFTQFARRHRWLVDSPPVLTDEGVLMASVLLPRTLDQTTADLGTSGNAGREPPQDQSKC